MLLYICFYLQLETTNSAVLSLDPVQGTVQGITAGSAQVRMITATGMTFMSDNIVVMDITSTIIKLDPIVASLRVTLETTPDSRVSAIPANLELLSGLFFFRERAEVTASVILEDGRRVVITDPSELTIQSSNISIVSVSDNYIIAEESGTVVLTVKLRVCSKIIAMSQIEITVDLEQDHPVFIPNTETVEVPENSPIGYTITVVEANVMGDASDIQYRIKSPDPYNGLLLVDQTTGEVILNNFLDRDVEGGEMYILVIEATDREQRLFEQGAGGVGTGGSEGGLGSGSGSGSGGGVLMPDTNDTIPIDVGPPAEFTVSLICAITDVFVQHHL